MEEESRSVNQGFNPGSLHIHFDIWQLNFQILLGILQETFSSEIYNAAVMYKLESDSHLLGNELNFIDSKILLMRCKLKLLFQNIDFQFQLQEVSFSNISVGLVGLPD